MSTPKNIAQQRPHGRSTLKAVCCLLTALACQALAQPQQSLTYVDILHQLTDLDRLTHLQTGYKGGLFSSWDRNSRTRWGANGDAGQYLRVEPNGEAVMMDIDGPGVVYRTWSANPMGKIRIYLDHSVSPSYEWDFPDLFDGKLPPFIKPFVYRRDNPQSASDCYLPIPFAKHIKITADKAHGEYYHFNYVLFPKDRPVPSFKLPLSADEQAALGAAAEIWSHPGRDPKPRLPGQKTIAKKITIAPGETAALCNLDGGGVIRAVRARVQSEQRYAWRKLVLRGEWDGAQWPQVLTPLGPFFGFDWETAEYGSVPAGCQNGQAYQYYPMPFRKSANLSLKNCLERPATVEYEIEWAPLANPPADLTYFYARWRHEPDSTTFDYPFLETAGHGHFVGVSMPIDHPLAGWWGEGDEKVWVDDDDFPPYIGTGSEDYFGDAWGIRYLSGPSFGASSMKGHRTCNYRWHFMDFIPFTKRMRMTIENYGPNGAGPRGQYDYSSTAFWYQAELTPPFGNLRGVKYTGGDDPDSKPVTKEYGVRPFEDLNADNLRTYGLGITFTRQAEVLLADAVKSGLCKIITDALRPYEFDRERAVDFGAVAAGHTLAQLKLSVPADGVYQPRIYTAPESGIAEISLKTGDKALAISARPGRNVLELGSVFLKKGEHPAALVAVTAGHAIFDCFQLESVPRVTGAIEAEDMRVLRATGGAAEPRPSEPIDGVSGGRVLTFHGDKLGQGFVVSLGQRPALPYVLGVRPLLGPDCGIIQAFANGNVIGPEFDLYAAKLQPGPSVLPLGPVPGGVNEIEIRVVGKNPLANGFDADLDYLRWEPAILGPGTAEGVWAQVLRTHDCEYRPQDLGPAYSGGHQFWVQPCNLNGWVDIAIQIPKASSYEIIAKYTKSWDYANVQAFLDGQKLGPATDTYSAAVVPAEPITLGRVELTSGRHVLRFQAVGHNPESKGYLMGIDHVIVR
ncbi:MAG TPA: glycoside hydrolase family 172 protein [Verrucomicrobiae bacterium]